MLLKHHVVKKYVGLKVKFTLHPLYSW